jgi:hypothetical protein
MASTNKTTHYELSQYIGTDKPTYLTDYNQDMSKIDAGIYGAKSIADVNSTKIGDLNTLDTTDKSDLVSAINEVNSNEESLSGTVSGHTVSIGDLQGDVGNLVDLDTTDKSDLVSAINEVNGKADDNSSNIGNLTNLSTTAKNNLVLAINEVLTNLNNTKPVVLYDNASGNNGSITLSETSANFNYIEIYYRSTDNIYSCTKVYQPNNKEVDLSVNFYSLALYGKCEAVKIQGTAINRDKYGSWSIQQNGSASVATTADIYITRVVGYR